MHKRYINVLIKPTNNCNLRCKYCFSNNYTIEKLNMENFEKFIKLVTKYCDELQIVWHGGEPTLWGYDNFKRANEIIKKYSNGITVKQSIQSNCVYMDDKLIDFFSENNISIGSSFDGIQNEKTRGNTEKYLKTIEKLKSKNMSVGAICVITKQSTNALKDNYNYFKLRGQSLNLRPMIESGEALNNSKLFSVDIDEYILKINELLKIWFYDKECNINVEPFNRYLDMLINGKSGSCCFSSCVGKWFCLEPNGDITPCNRWFPNEYKYGNIETMKNFKDVYKSEGMAKLLVKSIERREKCKKNCKYFDLCNGGCNNEFLVNGDISNNNISTCKIFISIISELEKLLKETKNTNNINNRIKERVEKYLTSHNLVESK